MLFNSFEFILLFLPLTLFVFFKIGGLGHHRVAISWLVGASLFFYGWWNPAYLGLILGSILFNYSLGVPLASNMGGVNRKLLLVFGVGANIFLLGYFKYANFFIDNVNLLTGGDFYIERIILPLAISFFTFQQITYIVDAYRGETKEYNFLHYCLFVTFFPQLIAGPIVHHREMLPQFAKNSIYIFNNRHFNVGVTIFFLGLFKKVVMADGIAVYASPVFVAAENGVALTFFDAWLGAFAYTFQLYFDFSGYSDMAIGIGRMFGIRLPINFNSPYKAGNIIDFWRRWHITLSRFLRDYLYIPLGGKRKGSLRRYQNLMITMLLGGLWHGAGWTFVIWGALHGAFLSVNHLWRALGARYTVFCLDNSLWWRVFAHALTLVCVIIAWVFFRATSFDGALNIIGAMFGSNGISLPENYEEHVRSVFSNANILRFDGMFTHSVFSNDLVRGLILVLSMLIAVVVLPNTQQIMYGYLRNKQLYGDIKPYVSRLVLWSPNLFWFLVMIVIALMSLNAMLGSVSEFLYFQF
jgi:D-alanyl-lipoteichoic acid acyltransferase DltB (MBOAT superfamily)